MATIKNPPLINAMSKLKQVIDKADIDDLEKSRYMLAEIKSAIEKRLKENDDE